VTAFVISALFNETISTGSLNSNSFYIYDNDLCDDNGGEEGHKENIENDSGEVYFCFPGGGYTTGATEGSKKCYIKLYFPYLNNETNYIPRLTSEIKDSYGNCFNPGQGPGGTGQR